MRSEGLEEFKEKTCTETSLSTLVKINMFCERGPILRGNFSFQASIFEKKAG